MLDLKSTLILIEHLRSEMIALFNEKGDIVDSEVLQVSQMLDKLINHYHYLVK